MRIIGLTGGAATGKTTVAAHLEQLGAEVIEADSVAREVVARGEPALAQVIEVFGHNFLLPTGELNRQKMADLIFADEAARNTLNAILHPLMLERMQTDLDRLATRSHESVVVMVAAVLYEMGWDRLVEGVIALVADAETRIRRLARRGIDRVKAQQIINAQMPPDELCQRARWVVSTEGTKEDTLRRVTAVWQEIAHGGIEACAITQQ